MNEFLHLDILGSMYFDEIYFYYEEPQLFLCKNTADNKFLAVLSDTDPYYVWYLAPVSLTTISQYKNRHRDLHSVFVRPDLGYVWKVQQYDDGACELFAVKPEDIPDNDLPTKGTYLFQRYEDKPESELTKQAVSECRDILEVAIEEENKKRAASEKTTQTQYSLSSGAANVKEVTK